MRKKLLSTILVTSMVATSLLVGCGSDNKSKENATSSIETTMDESSSVEETTLETTTSVEEESSTIEEVTTSAENTTSNEDTSKVEEESTSKVVEVETTTKAPETTTSKKPEPTTTKETTTSKKEPTKKPQETTTTKPQETTTSAPKVESEITKKIKSFHLAKYPDEAKDLWLKTVEGVGWVTEYGPTYRDAADNVDPPMPDCNDTLCFGDAPCGHYPSPYTTLEWTTRKYWGDKDEATVGFYSTDKERRAKKHNELVKQIEEAYSDLPDCCHIELENLLVGTYDNQYVWFTYFFRDCVFQEH